MSIVLGFNAKLFRGEAGSQASILMTNVRDLTLNIEKGEADITTRASNGWRSTIGTLKSGTLEFQMNYDTQDEDYNAVKNAFINDKNIAFFISDGEGNGLDADFSITAFNEEQPSEDVIKISVTAKPATVSRAPQFVGAVSSETE